METFRTVRRLAGIGVGALAVITLGGGVALSVVEEVRYLDGLWLAFSVVSTTGFGTGPDTSGGMGVSMLLFILALPAYVVLIAGAMVLAQELNPSVRRTPRPMVVDRDVRRVARDLNRN